MKNYKQILEAINKGIKLALDDFEDGDIQTQKVGGIKNQNLTKDAFEVYDLVVDFGLPSGTLWGKYNIGCNWNKLNKDPEHTKPEEWLGSYYAWGEIEDKNNDSDKPYDWHDYKHANHYWDFPEYEALTKYCIEAKCGYKGFVDNLTTLLPEDDVAYFTDKRFKIPTKEQFEELMDNVPYIWAYNYHNIPNLNGKLFKSNTTGAELFFPANGHLRAGEYVCIGIESYYWTSSLLTNSKTIYSKSQKAWCYEGWISDHKLLEKSRCCGLGIHPVLNIN